ncbi:glycosyltransferase [Vibrio cholerae]|uniref:glycosyltransferase n=1 Tax=Vibrio cholerae TaxID=666 RepID=UPI0011D482E5|nr:glycosyltransferase [Vibrio cholerae]EGR2422869.1 glycosyltransferase family 1 protein [Vibrio cholerae]EJL6619151.1 glycosyltransferase family 1 protein [Vibrio cholerae]EKF9704159.1 glycosyltransferase family 1 protein [Vibrio cholerae]ELI9714529.1 glycosyltransferase family 1 protein [Vibrio cholerae]MDA5311897.1 glycosyltransferase family 1 protein [Vibrio cholerae]
MKKNVCLIYAWENFKPSYLEKDVGLFPRFFAKASKQRLECLIYDSIGIKDEVEGRLYQSKSYVSFLFDCIIDNFSRLRRVKYFILFHVSLRTCLLSAVLKVINPSSKIIVKTDLSVSNVNYLSEMRKKNAIKYYLMRFFNKTVDAFCIETVKPIDLLLDKHKGFIAANKIYCVPNGVVERERLSSEPIRKCNNSITIITRDDSPLKGADRISYFLNYLDKALKKYNITTKIAVSVIGSLSENTRNEILYSSKELPLLQVHLLGCLDRESTITMLEQSELFVNLSLEESYCFALVEAALACCYIVTTPVGVATDLSLHYSNMSVLDYNSDNFIEAVVRNLTCSCGNNRSFDCLFDKGIYNWDRILNDFYSQFSQGGK